MSKTRVPDHSMVASDRPGPFGLRRPRCDELASGPILARPPIRAIQTWLRP